MKTLLFASLFAAMLLPAQQPQQPKRPRILGISHIALFVHDIEKSRAYYTDLLGFKEVFKLDKPDGSLFLTFVKINDRQVIELYSELAPSTDRLNHIAVQVDDAEAMRAYLASKEIGRAHV